MAQYVYQSIIMAGTAPGLLPPPSTSDTVAPDDRGFL